MIQQTTRGHETKPPKRIRFHPLRPTTSASRHTPPLIDPAPGIERETREIRREILGERRVRDNGANRGRYLAALKRLPVDFAEEAVSLDGMEVLGHVVAQAFGGFFAHEAGEEVLGIWAEEIGQGEFLFEDFLLELGVVVCFEGWGAC